MSHKVVIKAEVVEEGDEIPVAQSAILTCEQISEDKLKIWYTKVE